MICCSVISRRDSETVLTFVLFYLALQYESHDSNRDMSLLQSNSFSFYSHLNYFQICTFVYCFFLPKLCNFSIHFENKIHIVVTGLHYIEFIYFIFSLGFWSKKDTSYTFLMQICSKSNVISFPSINFNLDKCI